MNGLLEALNYPFMQQALWVALLLGVTCAMLSCFLVLKGWALMGDAISHAILPGIVIAAVSGLPHVTITEEGIYVLSGTATDCTVIVDTEQEDAKVQLVLQDVSITNTDAPCIYVQLADKVFVTLSGDNNYLAVTGTFAADGEDNPNAVIYSKDDLTLNGTGSAELVCAQENGVTGKDDLKATGGTWTISAGKSALKANDSVCIYDGAYILTAGSDGIHSEYDEDDSVGFVYVAGGSLQITAEDDGIRGTTYVVIDGGSIDITAPEGIEATCVQLNDGDITINATDDGINGSSKSSAYSAAVEINGGNLDITMGSGDTDAIDSNGSLTINDGTITISAQSPFDFDGVGALNGGTVLVNGTQITQLTGQMMGGMRGSGPMN